MVPKAFNPGENDAMSKSTATRNTTLSRRAPTALAGAVAIALYGGAGAAGAQQATLDEVVVTGIRASLTQSIERKRESATVVEVITAEDVGKFPDRNLAESLQRVPGVVINKEFGEGERVSLRGTAPNLTRTLLNGHGLATADWFILDQLNTTRSFNYLMLPSDIIGSVEVHKSSQANFEEGGIGGTINVITRDPLDLESMSFYGSAQVAYTDLADETAPQANALFSWKNDAENLGILVAGVYQQRKIRRDGVEVLGYFPVDIDPTAAVNEVLAPSLIGSALFQQDRKRTGGNIGIQFQPERPPRIQSDRALLQVRRRQHQPELPDLGHARDWQWRNADKRDDRRRHCSCRPHGIRRRRHGRFRRRLRCDQPLRVRRNERLLARCGGQ